LAKRCHRLAGENFNIQPNLKLALIRPDFAHLWPGITVNHRRNIKAARAWEKRFVSDGLRLSSTLLKNQKRCTRIALHNASVPSSVDIAECDSLTLLSMRAPGTDCKQKSLRRTITGAAQENTGLCLTNSGAQESPLVLQTNLPAGEKVCDRRDGLSAAARARTDCQDQIT
jgi:hypothetical protein